MASIASREPNGFGLQDEYLNNFDENRHPGGLFAGILTTRADELGEESLGDLACWLARNGRGGGVRVLGLMEALSPRRDACGLDVLGWAARGGDESCLLLAGEACGAENVDQWGGGALHHWVETKRSAAGAGAQILLAFGADPTRRDRWGLLPMHWSRDPSVWAWSMAALWSRGEQQGWRYCNGVDYLLPAAALGNLELPQWIRRSAWGASPERGQRDEGSGGATWDANLFLGELAVRRQMISQMIARQNCIAERLGIELLLGAEPA